MKGDRHEARQFTEDGITWMEQPDGEWLNLNSEHTFDAAAVRHYFPWQFNAQDEECTCDERPNSYGIRCPSCRAYAHIHSQEALPY